MRIEKDLNRPEMRRLFAEQPEKFHGFSEWDEPNFSFRHVPCNFYSGTKALAEQAIRGVGQGYIWRASMLSTSETNPETCFRNSNTTTRVYDNVNSISHIDDFVRACLDLWDRQAAFGIYNVTNPGAVTMGQMVDMIQRIIKPNRHFEFGENDEEFYGCHAKRRVPIAFWMFRSSSRSA